MGKGRDKRKKVKRERVAREALAAEREKKKRLGADSGGKVVIEEHGAVGQGARADGGVTMSKGSSLAKKKRKNKSDARELEDLISDIRDRDRTRTTVDMRRGAPPPPPRLNCSVTLYSPDEMVVFGGEFYDGNPVNTQVFSELHRLHVPTNEWTHIDAVNPPPPRCSHQTVVYRGHMYMFGGEFCTGDKFHHYRDLWRLDLSTWHWEEVKARGGPSARSGHRMTIWRNHLVLFGGFYEAFKETQWFNDLFLFSFAHQAWRKVELPITAAVPPARSGCQIALWEDTLYVHGGYLKRKHVSGSEARIHRDSWAINLASTMISLGKANGNGRNSDALDGTSRVGWERISRRGHTPGERAGAVMTVFKHRAVQFGGVQDIEHRSAELSKTAAIFFNDLHAFDMLHRRWYDIPLQEPKDESVKSQNRRRRRRADKAPMATTTSIQHQEQQQNKEDDEEEDEEEEKEEKEQQQLHHQKEIHQLERDKEQMSVTERLSFANDLSSSFGLDDLTKALADCDSDEESAVYVDETGKLIFQEDTNEEQNMSLIFPDPPVSSSQHFTGTELSATYDLRSADSSVAQELLPPPPPSSKSQPRYEYLDGMICRISATRPTHEAHEVTPTTVKGSRIPNVDGTQVAAEKTLGREKSGFARSGASIDEAKELQQYPRPRINPGIFMRGHTLYIYGGVIEQKKREWALDDLWSLDLNKRDKWRCHIRCTVTDFSVDDTSDTDSGSDVYSEDDEDDSDSESVESKSSLSSQDSHGAEAHTIVESVPQSNSIYTETVRQLREEHNLDDPSVTPHSGETLRDFFARSVDHWAGAAYAEATRLSLDPPESDKDLRSVAFRVAQHRFEKVQTLYLRIRQLKKLESPSIRARAFGDSVPNEQYRVSMTDPIAGTAVAKSEVGNSGIKGLSSMKKKKTKRRSTPTAQSQDGRMAMGCPLPPNLK